MTTTATSESTQQPQAAAKPAQPGAGALAAGASFFVPGFGHVLAKSPLRGLLFFVLWAVTLTLSYRLLDSYENIGKLPTLLVITIALMVIASIDALIVGMKKGLIAGGCIVTYTVITFIATVGFAYWAINDAMNPMVGPKKDFAGALGSLSGKYAIAISSVGVILLILGLLGRKNLGLSAVVRIGLGILIAMLLFWPHDKMVQNTIIGMRNSGQIIVANDDSMSPNILAGDWVVVHKDAPVQRFDARLLLIPAEEREDGKPRFLNKFKRIYGMPGEELEIIAGTLMINRNEMELPSKAPRLTWSPHPMRLFAVGEAGHGITLRGDEYYVLGDNLDGAYDSRYALPIPDSGYRQPGAIPQANVGGRATFRLLPFSRFGSIE